MLTTVLKDNSNIYLNDNYCLKKKVNNYQVMTNLEFYSQFSVDSPVSHTVKYSQNLEVNKNYFFRLFDFDEFSAWIWSLFIAPIIMRLVISQRLVKLTFIYDAYIFFNHFVWLKFQRSNFIRLYIHTMHYWKHSPRTKVSCTTMTVEFVGNLIIEAAF